VTAVTVPRPPEVAVDETPLRHIAIIGSRGFPSTYGGYETAVRYIARDWVARGIDVTVYCRERDAGRRSWTAEGVHCKYTPGLESTSLSTLTFGATGIAHAALRRRPDAALVLNIANGFWLPMLKRAAVPTALNTDGIEWERGKWSALGKKVFYAGAKASAAYADVLVCDSEAIGDIWEREFGVTSEFVPYGAPVREGISDERVRSLGITPRAYALAVARLIPENNVDLFVDAIERTAGAVPAVVVGSANYQSPLERRLRKLDHRGLIRWLGHVDDQELLSQLWANAGVYVHGHSVGGTNPALLQAMGMGAPTIAFDSPFNREVLGHEAANELYGDDPAELSGLMGAVINDGQRRDAMRVRGIRRVRERYDWADVAQRYLDALALAREKHLRSPSPSATR
jgi:glycosyltransferase involved in cell wall biosynthesis